MKKPSGRLNDTVAVVGMVPYESQHQHYSRTVRKIDNGFVTSEYSHNPNDPEGPTSKEVFTHDHPDADSASLNAGGSMMKRAVDVLNRR